MTVREEIEYKKPELQRLCHTLGIKSLFVQVSADQWDGVTFIGDVDATHEIGYGDRFFGLEDGLLKIFQRRMDLIDQEAFEKLSAEHNPCTSEPVELLNAS